MKKWIASGLIMAAHAFAITGGPTMPEFTQFEEVTASNWVDPNSGNFTYSIPLMEVPSPEGSYPLDLSYHSGIRYNQEATWVGLGWSLNAGAINRILRGVPDDYFNSVVATRNVSNESGRTLNVNLGYGPYGLSMAWDYRTGEALSGGFTYSYGGTSNLGLGISAGPSLTMGPGGVSMGIGVGLPIGTININLYDQGSNSSTGVGFTPGLGSLSAFHSSGSQIGTGVGQGSLYSSTKGASFSAFKVHVDIGLTDWRYELDETNVDYMCGFLFQDGVGAGFKNRMSTAKAFLSGGQQIPRQRFERTKYGNILYPSSDIYEVAANGISGSFQPYLTPDAPKPTFHDDNGPSNQGWMIENPAKYTTGLGSQITFRMDGDKGFNLLHNGSTAFQSTQVAPVGFTNQFGVTENQYGSYRITPIFDKISGSTEYSNVISGFVIKNADGITYEYAMPTYTFLEADYLFKHLTLSTEDRQEKVNGEKYANSWLLTAVKGADYLPINHTTRAPAAGDLGHWVKFNYTAPVLSNWSTPYKGNVPPESKNDPGYCSRAYGVRQLVYLASIETQSHKATFSTVPRSDVPISTNNPVVNAGGGQSTNPLTYDDGLVATKFINAINKSYYSGSTSLVPEPFMSNNGSGGFPIEFNGLNVVAPDVQSADFTFVFPGMWGQLVLQARNKVANNFDDNLEKIFGLHVKYDWRDGTVIGNSSIWHMVYDNRSPIFTGKTKITESSNYNGGDYAYFEFNCPDIKINDAGEAEVTCHFKATAPGNGNQTIFSVHDLQIVGAFINWPELERLKSLTYSQPQALAGITLTEKATKTITKEIRFGYDMSLCNNIPGNTGISGLAATYPDAYLSTDDTKNKGKLTLKKVMIFGTGGMAAWKSAGSPAKDGIKLPDYTFEYQGAELDAASKPNPFNPSYGGSPYYTDYWGMYSPVGGITPPAGMYASHAVKQQNIDPSTGLTVDPTLPHKGGDSVGVCWNLQRINLPTGGSIKVGYKRDEYYFGGIAKDASSGNQIAIPDIFDIDFPMVSGLFDPSSYYKLTTIDFSTKNNLPNAMGNYPSKNGPLVVWPTLDYGPDNKSDYEIKPASSVTPMDLKDGDFVAVVYKMENWAGPPPHKTIFNGICNIAIINRTDLKLPDGSTQKRVNLIPLVEKNSNGKFFYLQSVMPPSSSGYFEYHFSYYLVPVKNKLGRKIYGGDVAVNSLQLDNGFGNVISRNFNYSPNGSRNSQGIKMSDTATYASGALWKLPEMAWQDKYHKYAQSPSGPLGLAFQALPIWNGTINGSDGNPGGLIGGVGGMAPICSTFTNPITGFFDPMAKFLDDAYWPESRMGGIYLPDANVSYSRIVDSLGDGKAGSTEFQFYNLAYSFLNNNIPYNHSALTTDPLKFNDWKVTGTFVQANLLALNGKLIRKLELNSAKKIIAGSEYHYNLVPNSGSANNEGDVGVYTNVSNEPGLLSAYPLGAVQQCQGSTINGPSNFSTFVTPSITFFTPSAFLVSEKNTLDGVSSEIDYPFFDNLSGEALLSVKKNSDGNGIATYKLPLHWFSSLAKANNQLSLAAEERTYAVLPNASNFNRDDLSIVFGSIQNQWESLPIQLDAGTKTTAGFLYKSQSYSWVSELFEHAPANAYVPFSGTTPFNGTTDPSWRPNGSRITLLNRYGYPLEKVNDITSVYSSEFTGYGNNMVIGSITNAKWNTSSIYTCDYVAPNPKAPTDLTVLDYLSGWTRDNVSNAIVSSAGKHFGTMGITLGSGGTISNSKIVINPAQPVVTVHFFAKATTGKITLQAQPINAGGNVGAPVTKDVTSTSWSSTGFDIDLSQAQYAGATNLKVSVSVAGTSVGSVDDIRVHPTEALVKTHYYDPATYKILTVVDENRNPKRFSYDTRGRLSTIVNSAGQTVSQAKYNDYQ